MKDIEEKEFLKSRSYRGTNNQNPLHRFRKYSEVCYR